MGSRSDADGMTLCVVCGEVSTSRRRRCQTCGEMHAVCVKCSHGEGRDLPACPKSERFRSAAEEGRVSDSGTYACVLCDAESAFPPGASAEAPCVCGDQHHLCLWCYEHRGFGGRRGWTGRLPLGRCPIETRVAGELMGGLPENEGDPWTSA